MTSKTLILEQNVWILEKGSLHYVLSWVMNLDAKIQCPACFKVWLTNWLLCSTRVNLYVNVAFCSLWLVPSHYDGLVDCSGVNCCICSKFWLRKWGGWSWLMLVIKSGQKTEKLNGFNTAYTNNIHANWLYN